MDKSIKQRLLGGVVLAAGAALFLPLFFDGSGAGLPAKPSLPAKPAVPTVEDMAPKLEQQAAALEQSVATAHAEQTFYPVEAAPAAAAAAATVAPATPAEPAQAAAETEQVERLAQEKERLAQQAAQDAQAREKAEAARLATQQARAAAEKAEQQRLAAEKAKQEAAKRAAAKPADSALPEAWVVQVASLSRRDKADELLAKLRKRGYQARIQGSDGAWKVLVGPELRKEVATAIRQRLADDPELKLAGWIQAYNP